PDNSIDIKVSVNVETNFKGMAFTEATTANYGHSCAWDFKEGDRFLFYAGLDKNNLSDFGTSFCHRTRRYSDNLVDLDFLNAVKKHEDTFWIWATIRSGYGDEGLKGVRAELIGHKEKI